MIATLHVPYSNGDCLRGFKHDGDIVSADYARMMIKDYREHAPKVDQIMQTQYGYNVAKNGFEKEHREYNPQTVIFNSVECQILDKDKKDVTLERLAEWFEQKKKFVLTVTIRANMSEKPEMGKGRPIINVKGERDMQYSVKNISGVIDLAEDIKQWMRETLKILNTPEDVMDDSEKLKSMSTKDLKLTFRDSVMFAVLRKCKMVKVISNNQFCILVDRVMFLKERGR